MVVRLTKTSCWSWLGLLLLSVSCGGKTLRKDNNEEDESHPHGGSIAERVDCANCHTTSGWKTSSEVGVEGGFDHAKTGFPLTGEHSKVGCADCHEPGVQVRRMCKSCHDDIHQGRLGAFCDSCHNARDFRLLDAVDIHRGTQLPLTGMHVLADCSECHVRTTSRSFSHVPADCYACHSNDYLRPDLIPRHQGSASTPAFSTNCAECHSAVGWSPAIVSASAVGSVGSPLLDAFDHESVFPVQSGPHRGAVCASCHQAPDAPALLSCIGCHTHSPARIQQVHQTPVPLDGQACVTCHPGGRRL